MPRRLLLLLTCLTFCATAAADRPADQPKPGSKGAMLQALVYGTLTAELNGTPARSAFQFVAESLDINMIVRYVDDANAFGFGIDPDTPITFSFEEMPAISVLEEILSQCSGAEPCTWQLRRGYVEAGTTERLSAPAAREIRSYPVDELLFEPPMFDDAPEIDLQVDWGLEWRDGLGGTGYGGAISASAANNAIARESVRKEAAEELITMIVDAIEPRAWRVNGGDWATINYQRGVLLVRAPDYIHRQINGYPYVPPRVTAGHD